MNRPFFWKFGPSGSCKLFGHGWTQIAERNQLNFGAQWDTTWCVLELYSTASLVSHKKQWHFCACTDRQMTHGDRASCYSGTGKAIRSTTRIITGSKQLHTFFPFDLLAYSSYDNKRPPHLRCFEDNFTKLNLLHWIIWEYSPGITEKTLENARPRWMVSFWDSNLILLEYKADTLMLCLAANCNLWKKNLVRRWKLSRWRIKGEYKTI
jgi:hypothetical protein